MRSLNATDQNIRHERIHRDFLVESELAERWNKTRRTIQRMRSEGGGPAYHRIGGSILYKLEDIEAFEAEVRIAGGAT